MKLKLAAVCLAGVLIANSSWSQKKDSTLVLIPDDPIASMLDSLMTSKYFECNSLSDTCLMNIHNYQPGYVPVFDDMVYESRMAKLDAQSPFDLVYNSAVRSYIDMYTNRKRNLVSRMLGLSKVYFPLFEESLDKFNLPLELKYLAIVESALNPNAISKSGATGLWQFMYPTGKMFGLNVTSYVDERRDPFKATIAACQYFTYLYKMFNDWQLVLAAYNGGPGTVNKAIRRSGGKRTYWEVRPYLPLETQGYVPAFIAVNYVMNHTTDHNLYPVPVKTEYLLTDTVNVKSNVCFEQISKVLEVQHEDLVFLNPCYKKGIIPFTGDKYYSLCLPVNKVGAFINNEAAVYKYIPASQAIDSVAYLASLLPEVKKTHTVKKGESVKLIASKYNCDVADIKNWNRLKSTKSVRPGTKLTVYVRQEVKQKTVVERPAIEMDGENVTPDSVATTIIAKTEVSADTQKVAEVKQPSKKYNTAKPKIHVVQKGDTLWNIASRYEGVTVGDLRKINGLKNGKITVGMKLKVQKI